VRENGIAGAVARLAEPLVTELGFRLVTVVVNGQAGGTVQIRAERSDGTLTISDCEKISRALSPVLDAYDPVSHPYRLEVSSPGIDRPLVRPSDFETWSGHEAKIELKELVSGRRRFRGRIEGLVDGEARLVTDVKGEDGPQVIGFPIELIDTAKLVMTDELVAESLRRRKVSGAPPEEFGDGSEMD